jgi:hypothetical protein
MNLRKVQRQRWLLRSNLKMVIQDHVNGVKREKLKTEARTAQFVDTR